MTCQGRGGASPEPRDALPDWDWGGAAGGAGLPGAPGTLGVIAIAAATAATTLPATLSGATPAGPLTEAAAAITENQSVDAVTEVRGGAGRQPLQGKVGQGRARQGGPALC